MFKGTKKAFERAPTILGGHHKKDPEIEIWTRDFAAAKVAVNTIDREITESQLSINNFIKSTLELYNVFVAVADGSESSNGSGTHIPSTTILFAPVQEIVGRVEALAHAHAKKTITYTGEIRLLATSVEDLLKKADHKKVDCDRLVQHDQLDYDDPKASEIPEVQEYLRYHYHMISLVPQVLKKLDKLMELLVQKQLGYQLQVFELVGDAIKKVAQTTSVTPAQDNIEVLQRWSTQMEPVVEQLAKTKTIGKAAVMPPPPHTWKRVQHAPHAVASALPSAQQTKTFASEVEGSFKYGLSYIYPMDVKFYNPHRGMFGDISESELRAMAEGRPSGDATETETAGITTATATTARPEPAPGAVVATAPVTATATATAAPAAPTATITTPPEPPARQVTEHTAVKAEPATLVEPQTAVPATTTAVPASGAGAEAAPGAVPIGVPKTTTAAPVTAAPDTSTAPAPVPASETSTETSTAAHAVPAAVHTAPMPISTPAPAPSASQSDELL